MVVEPDGGHDRATCSNQEVAVLTYAAIAGAGLAVGAMYALLHVRSPAPPLVALTGLAGMLIGYGIPGALT
ncbi:DUF1427 family protein [Streptomyces sp. NPDC059278]|uniref:DUF1427 family protein n=1 Tax=Streptomyces sp. NPDC059278 TaxID=3346801 RepID=UPI003693FA51